jgi:predicted nucleotidyltransferase component of viral defense system
MPIYDRLKLGRVAREYGFIRDTFEKMSRLIEVLQFINSEPELNSILALKGGTAINLTIFDLPRLSVDIDLDLTENYARDEMLIKRARINELLARFMTGEGYTQKEKSKQVHALDSLVYSYRNTAGNFDNIKIEINYISRCHAFMPSIVPVKSEKIFSDFLIRSLDPIEIFASKISALLSRTAARDVYDVNNMILFELFDIEQTLLLKKCLVFYLAISTENIPETFDYINLDNLNYHDIKMRLIPMLRKKDSFDINIARERIKKYLTELLQFSDSENEFLVQFRNGQYKPELLFDGDILIRIKNHPMAIWKMMNRNRGN